MKNHNKIKSIKLLLLYSKKVFFSLNTFYLYLITFIMSTFYLYFVTFYYNTFTFYLVTFKKYNFPSPASQCIKLNKLVNSTVSLTTSGGATGGPAGHWPTQFSVWPTQFFGSLSFLAHTLFMFGSPSFCGQRMCY